MPKVTVVMSAYNAEKHLRESIDSILNQTFEDFEFVIIDDGSTDKTFDILKSYQDLRIKIINNEKNIGITRSLNIGLKFVSGEYVARMDADDISEPKRLEKQVEFLDAHPSVGVVGINSLIIDEQGNLLGQISHPISHSKIMSQILLDNRFVHSSVMLRKTLLAMHGCYNGDVSIAQDYELFLRLALVTQLANLPEPLHRWRRNYSTGISMTRKSEQLMARDKIRQAFLDEHFTLDEDYIHLLLINYRNNPKDIYLRKYLHRILEELSRKRNLFFLRIKIRCCLMKWF